MLFIMYRYLRYISIKYLVSVFKIYWRSISYPAMLDSICLQKVDTVVEWASCWQMQFNFNVKKCKVVHFGKENLGFTYSMEGHCLENVDWTVKKIWVL